ncbi:GerAB/ArcD/ProY family transporter [Virgibacillus siamensis]|uniref:GerAB/ArcD/ProY family transporter n=1 Tax=Virgibacillus siamensis TaxID=480071 RepID=UPI000985B91E|nr:GerAB/ArcD/ProY family transporter [Virgibacillus siamensis]
MIKAKDKVSPLMVFFVITASQVGVGVLGFQSVIIKYAGHDAWISVMLAGVGISAVIWIMYAMLNKDEYGDIVSIHTFVLGKWIGSVLTVIFSIYMLALAIVVMRTYLEIIQVWMFPHLSIWATMLFLLPLIYYIINGKFRTVVGVSFFGVVYPSFLILTMFFPLKYSRVANIMPVLDHTVIEIIQSSYLAILNFMGFAALLVFYPFVEKARTSQKNAHYGNLYITLLYTLICVVSFVYYNQYELKETIWATLGLWKIMELPIIARFEYFGIATLFFSILPNIALYTWASGRALSRQLNISHRKITYVLLGIIFIACLLFDDRKGVNFLNSIAGKIGSYFLFVYIPILFVLHWIRRKVSKNAS